MTGAIFGALAGGVVAAVAAWLTRRSVAIDTFFTRAAGATSSLRKADSDPDTAKWLAGEIRPLADTLGMRIPRLRQPANAWADALERQDLAQAEAAQERLKKKGRFAGFG